MKKRGWVYLFILLGILAGGTWYSFTFLVEQSAVKDLENTSFQMEELTTNLADESIVKVSFTFEMNEKEATEELEKKNVSNKRYHH
ncbi:hypothetical protein LC087_05050 [Bacillus carboniphilus]|uniref:Uncharacterized protein n=1 Tax=Bacillus carboniphilus TaxID=86663 RepID=A0ABY9JVU5_9BACI|nr:hypothetical protein [Bacillus carboniphilus]WLR43534.1 hypothetical protein LC087_05050 [Bacillus carboniphilus]